MSGVAGGSTACAPPGPRREEERVERERGREAVRHEADLAPVWHVFSETPDRSVAAVPDSALRSNTHPGSVTRDPGDLPWELRSPRSGVI